MQKNRATRTRPALVATTLVLVVVVAYVATTLLLPLEAIAAKTTKNTVVPAGTPTLVWPNYGQGALAAEGFGVLATHGDQTPVPIASITKIITALTVLEHKPVQDSTSSPVITFTAADAALFNAYLAKDGVVAPATAGTTITQYDLMQIMLVASANNYAETLAVWAFGSMNAYLAAAKSYLASHGLSHTSVADAAGFDPASSSSAQDLVQLGLLALKNPMIAKIVAEPSVSIPGIGTFQTTNLLVAQGKAIGIKTGNTDSAGQCLLFAQKDTIAGTSVTLVGALLGGSSRAQVATDAANLLTSAQTNFANTEYAKTREIFATYVSPWGAQATLISPSAATELTWAGDAVTISTEAPPISVGQIAVPGARATVRAGKISATTNLSLSHPLTPPSIWWRLTHPLAVWFGSR